MNYHDQEDIQSQQDHTHLPPVQFVEVRIELNVGAAVGHFMTSGINLKGNMLVIQVLFQHELGHAIRSGMVKRVYVPWLMFLNSPLMSRLTVIFINKDCVFCVDVVN